MNRKLKSIARALIPKTLYLRIQSRRRLRNASEAETQLLPILARSGIFLDIGANIGQWSLAGASAFRQVHAFEPDVQYASVLKRTMPRNVVVHALGLSDHSGVGRFSVPLHEGEELVSRGSLEPNANPGFEEVTREVSLTTLDSLDLTDIDLMKIDVEGHEASVLDGAWKTIDRERPTLIVEIEERHHPGRSDSIIQALTSRGYACRYLHRGRLKAYEPGTIGQLQRDSESERTGLRSADYINNFFFFPMERESEMDAVQTFLDGAKFP